MGVQLTLVAAERVTIARHSIASTLWALTTRISLSPLLNSDADITEREAKSFNKLPVRPEVVRLLGHRG
jgi:hypothetical protein